LSVLKVRPGASNEGTKHFLELLDFTGYSIVKNKRYHPQVASQQQEVFELTTENR